MHKIRCPLIRDCTSSYSPCEHSKRPLEAEKPRMLKFVVNVILNIHVYIFYIFFYGRFNLHQYNNVLGSHRRISLISEISRISRLDNVYFVLISYINFLDTTASYRAKSPFQPLSRQLHDCW